MTLTYNPKIMDGIREEHKKWQKKLDEIFRAAPERMERFSTVSDREIKSLYSPADMRDEDFERELGFPGEYPFTRGVQPSMYRGRLWTMRMFAGLGSCQGYERTLSSSWSKKARQGFPRPLICPH